MNKGSLSICSPVPWAMCQPQIISASAVARLQSPPVLAAPNSQDNMGTASATATSKAASFKSLRQLKTCLFWEKRACKVYRRVRGSHAVLEPPNSLCVFIMDEQEEKTRAGSV